jgi:hypothetical protein
MSSYDADTINGLRFASVSISDKTTLCLLIVEGIVDVQGIIANDARHFRPLLN